MRNIFLLIVAVLMIYSCNSNMQKNVEADFSGTGLSDQNTNENYYEQEIAEEAPTSPSNNQNSKKHETTKDEIAKIGRKIIKNSELYIEVSNYEKEIKHIKDTLKSFDCYIANENEQNLENYITNTINIRIKSAQFNTLMKVLLTGEKTIIRKNIHTSDVTLKYIDTYQRLKNKKSIEQQYLDILKKAKTIKEILTVQQYLREIQEEIESAKGQLLYWDNQTSYSTIKLTITFEKEKTAHSPDFLKKIWEGIKTGWQGATYFIIIIFTLWPLWILSGIIIFIIKKARKKRKTVKKNI